MQQTRAWQRTHQPALWPSQLTVLRLGAGAGQKSSCPRAFPAGTRACVCTFPRSTQTSPQVRDTDLDTLEQLVTCVTWGDIEAEDTRHLSEGNFVKVFRLAQLLLEYLLYVQENLKYTNGVLDKSRWG